MTVYIIYDRGDKTAADRVAAALRERGAAAYVDGQPPLPGEDFIGRLGPHIAAADQIIALLNPSAVRSKWVHAELAWALHCNKPIIVAVTMPDLSLLDCFFLIDQPRVDLKPWLDDPQQRGPLHRLLVLLNLPRDPIPLEPPPDVLFNPDALSALCASAGALAPHDGDRADFLYRVALAAAPDLNDAAAIQFIQTQVQPLKLARLTRLLIHANTALAEGRWADARHIAHEMQRLHPDNPDVLRRIIANCERNVHGDPLYQHASSAAAEGRWEVVGQLMASIKALYPAYGDPRGLLNLHPGSAPVMRALHNLRLYEHIYTPSALIFAPDGDQLAAAWPDRSIQIWRVNDGELLVRIPTGSRRVSGLAFSTGQRLIASAATGDDGGARLWSLDDAQESLAVQENTPCSVVAVSPDRQMLAVCMRAGGRVFARPRNIIRVWLLENNRQYSVFKDGDSHERDAQFVIFSPDSTVLASDMGGSSIHLWAVREKVGLGELLGHRDAVIAAAFSPDSALLATGSADWTVRLWRLAGDAEHKLLEGHRGRVGAVAFSPDGSLLASGGVDKTIRLWSVAEGRELATLTGHTAPVLALLFTPDRTRLLSASADGTVRIWGLA